MKGGIALANPSFAYSLNEQGSARIVHTDPYIATLYTPTP